MVKNIIKKFLAVLAIGISAISPIKAEVIEIDPLFEYPIAPEEIVSLTDKSNWLMQHFWDQMDFKKKEAVNQAALNDAFATFVFPMQWAEKTEVDKAVDMMIAQLQKNPTLLVQFTKAAEEALYGKRAKLWIDEIYLKYLDAFLKNKKVSDVRKQRYRRQYNILKNSQIGDFPKSFEFTTPTGDPGNFAPIGVFTIIEFGDPDCDDCRMAKLKLETDMRFTSLVDRGLVNIMFIIPDPVDGWQTKLGTYPSNWVVGASDTVSDILDIRNTPSFYIIGKDGKIVAKNASLEEVKRLAYEQETAN